MPEISRFFGIIIAMYFDDHSPPHFHIRFGHQKAIFDIEKMALLEGELSPRALGLVTEWAILHQRELLEDWELAQRHAPLKKIPPLE
ncbi:MAG: transcriptional regulator [Nitrospinae bacterium CG11_big_fil_rev_8_21_14_0_20_56_8]|nr:MAG: transcriptional regulator [Nitrospinae bacterium CG11_big_fil_rev_8_21_14_0_20_56_8]